MYTIEEIDNTAKKIVDEKYRNIQYNSYEYWIIISIISSKKTIKNRKRIK